MTDREDLDKLFEAALSETKAPTRFGTPEDQRKYSPLPPHQKVETSSAEGSRFRAMPSQNDLATPEVTRSSPQSYQQISAESAAPSKGSPVENPFQAAPVYFGVPDQVEPVPTVAGQAAVSLDTSISAELGAILDAKVAKEKRSKRRSLYATLLILLGLTGGASAWVMTNPERMEALKTTLADIKSAGDLKGMIAKYQEALDKVAVRGEQIDAATVSMGVDPASAEGMADQGFDKEMRDMMGEDSGPTSAARNDKLREKFKHVQEDGGLIKKD